MKKMISLFLSLFCIFLIAVSAPTAFPIRTQAASASQTIKLNKTKAAVYNGKKLKLKVSGTKAAVKWSTSNKKIATVKNGVVTPKKPGTVKIYANVAGQTLTCKVTVKSPLITSVSKLTLKERQTKSITVTWKLQGSIYYQVDNRYIATCEWSEGWDGESCQLKVKGEKAGKTIVTISNEITDDIIEIPVIVKYRGVAIVASTQNAEVKTGQTLDVPLTFHEEGELTCKVADPSVVKAEISSPWSEHPTLELTGKKRGTTRVTIMNEETGSQAVVSVTVKDGIVIHQPTLPTTIHEFDYRDDIEQTYTITSFSYETANYDEDDDNYTVYLYFGGEKSYDYRGYTQSSSAIIGWKLYDMDGDVIDSGSCYAPSVAMGDSWKEKAAKDYIWDLESGEYYLEILSVN